jgi:AraC-like DNA-binding protein
MFPARQITARLTVFSPPYRTYLPVDRSWMPVSFPARGHFLLWTIEELQQEDELEWVFRRPPGIPLVVLLPPPAEIVRLGHLVRAIPHLHPRAVLPFTAAALDPEHFRLFLGAPPHHMPEAVTDYLIRRRLFATPAAALRIRRVFEHALSVASVAALARRLHVTRRTLGRQLAADGLPAPSRWLQFARLLRVALHIATDRQPLLRLAARAGYPDSFTMSNQMKRMLDCRPSELRGVLGWEWLVESWLLNEVRRGGFAEHVRRDLLRAYDHLPGAHAPRPSPGQDSTGRQ